MALATVQRGEPSDSTPHHEKQKGVPRKPDCTQTALVRFLPRHAQAPTRAIEPTREMNRTTRTSSIIRNV